MRDLRAISCEYGQTEYWSFRFSQPFSWAIFSVNEATGEFSIVSDWGNYSHRWNVNHIGAPSMREFLATCTPSHIMGKFAYELSRKDTHVFDINATHIDLKRQIIESRREGFINKERAREGWDDLQGKLEALQGFYDGDAVATMLWEEWPSSLGWMECAFELFQYKPSSRYVFVEDQLIPFFQTYLGENLTAHAVGAI